MTNDDYITLDDAAAMLGQHRTAVSRLISKGLLPVYQRPHDQRRKLVKRADVEALLVPKPIVTEKGKAAA